MRTKPFFTLSSLFLAVLLLPGNQLTVVQSPVSVVTLANPDRAFVTAPVPGDAGMAETLQSSPVMFIENVGQFDARARFQVRGANRTVWLAEDALWITVLEPTDMETRRRGDTERFFASPSLPVSASQKGVNLKLTFPGANPHPRLEPFDRLDTHVSYFIGNDPEKWHPDVPVWGGLRYVDLYPGADLEVTGEEGRWAWRFAIRDSQFAISGVRLRVDGADDVELLPAPDESGASRLRLTTAVGEFNLPLLTVEGLPVERANVQRVNGQAFDITAPFSSAPSLPLSSAPLLSSSPAPPHLSSSAQTDLLYATFLGGSYWDGGDGIAVDASGAAYVTGDTESSDFPTTPGAFDTSFNDSGYTDAFVVKLNGAGSALAYATFLGGSYWDGGDGIAVDASGAAYVTGDTESSDFPTTPGAFDRSLNGDTDAFVVKLNGAGSTLTYATLLGGSRHDWVHSIAVDASGAAYVTGYTESSNFPATPGAFGRSHNGGWYDAFVVKLNRAGSALAYATFLGGGSEDRGYGIAVDASGAVYVTGWTGSSDFPTTPGAFDRSLDGYDDAFVVKLNGAGSALAYATFLGGGSDDSGYGIAVDAGGAAYVTGDTNSSNFPATPGAFDRSHNGYDDAFVVKLNGAGSVLAYATFLGGRDRDWGVGIAVDGSGVAYVTGETKSFDFPTTPGAFDTAYNNNVDTFVAKLNGAGTALAYATFLGGSGNDCYYSGCAIAVDESRVAYVTGRTDSSNFPTTPGAFDTTYNGGGDAFVVKLAVGSGATGREELISALNDLRGAIHEKLEWDANTVGYMIAQGRALQTQKDWMDFLTLPYDLINFIGGLFGGYRVSPEFDAFQDTIGVMGILQKAISMPNIFADELTRRYAQMLEEANNAYGPVWWNPRRFDIERYREFIKNRVLAGAVHQEIPFYYGPLNQNAVAQGYTTPIGAVHRMADEINALINALPDPLPPGFDASQAALEVRALASDLRRSELREITVHYQGYYPGQGGLIPQSIPLGSVAGLKPQVELLLEQARNDLMSDYRITIYTVGQGSVKVVATVIALRAGNSVAEKVFFLPDLAQLPFDLADVSDTLTGITSLQLLNERYGAAVITYAEEVADTYRIVKGSLEALKYKINRSSGMNVTGVTTPPEVSLISLETPSITLAEGESVGEGQGQATIRNDSDTAAIVLLSANYLGDPDADGELPIVGMTIAAAPVTLAPHETRTIPFAYQVTASALANTGGYEVQLYLNAVDQESGAQQVFGPYRSRFWVGTSSELNALQRQSSATVMSGYLGPGDAQESLVDVVPIARQVRLTLSQSGNANIDLHAYDPVGNHVGLNYSTGQVDSGIAGAGYSGPEAATEWIEVPAANLGSVRVQAVAREAPEGTQFNVGTLQSPPLPALLSVSPREIRYATNALRTTTSVRLSEAGGTSAIESLRYDVAPLVDGVGTPVAGSSVTMTLPMSLAPGAQIETTLYVSLPPASQDITYSTRITITGYDRQNDQTVSDKTGLMLMLDRRVPTAAVLPLPAETPITVFRVSWSGADPAPGSGIASYDVQFRKGENGVWTEWLVQTPLSSALFGLGQFRAERMQTYCFRARAHDLAGNVGTYTNAANGDTCTTVVSGPMIYLPVVLYSR